MPDTKKLARFLVLPSSNGSDPQLIIELEDGLRLTFAASWEQIEDMADMLDEILDATPPEDESGPNRLPAFLRKGGPNG